MPLSPSLDAHSTGVIDDPFILKLQGITKYYYSQTVPAVKNISLTLKHGDILGLLGPSGCGKTTLLRFIAGFEKTQSGSLWLCDRLVAGPQVWAPPEERDIGMVFQDFALFPHLSVFENIAFGLKSLFHRKKGLIQGRVIEVLDLVGLTGLQHRYPHELSGGQQQRIALARALAPKPKLVLLDEPLSNLDVQVRLHLRQELRAILKAAKTSAIFVTHDQEEALAISDQVAVMKCGELEQVGSPEEIFSAPASKFVAEFVTQANFLRAERHDQTWKTELGCFDAWVLEDSREHPHQSGWLMIRQEDMLLKPDHQGRAIILDHQFLGREYRYRLRTPSGQILYALSKSTEGLAKGVTVSIAARAQSLQIFPQEAKTYG
jgi:iron(III) transport system ATP-binding protein